MSNGVTMSDGGKGSAPRKNRDDEAYSKGWDAIFGKDKRKESDEQRSIFEEVREGLHTLEQKRNKDA